MESWVQSWRPGTKLLRLPRKSDARSYEVLHLSHKIMSANLKIWCSKMPLRKSAPGPPNSSDEHVSCTAAATEIASLQILFKCLTPAIVFGNATKPLRFAHFDKVHNPLRLPRKATSERPNVLRTPQFFALLTSKCASRHNGVHFFDISTSKSGPNMRCFVHFDFEMCFVPQRRALFRHLNLQKCSERVVSLAFSLANVLCATTACNFSSLIWPARSASAALASLLFDPPEPQIIGKTQCFATCLLRLSLFWSSFFFSSLLWLFPSFPISAPHLSILSEVWLLNFLR